MTTLAIGARVRLTRDIDNYPDAYVRAGATGVVVRIDGDDECDDAVWVRLDDHVPDLDGWNNELAVYGTEARKTLAVTGR